MIVEFTGCTGSGKTTISRSVIKKIQSLGLALEAVHPDTPIHGRLLSRGLSEVCRHNYRTDLETSPWSLFAILHHPIFVGFVLREILRNPDRHVLLAMLRSVFRKIAIQEVLTWKAARGSIVVVDEGIVHIAHNLLASINGDPDATAVGRFAGLVPPPDLIVHVSAPPDVLLRRTFCRVDSTPRCRNRRELERFVRNAISVFQVLMRHKRIADRAISLEYPVESDELANALADRVVARILTMH